MNNNHNIDTIIFSKKLKLNILEMAYHAGSSSSHFGGALSIVDIISVIFSNYITDNSINKNQFILSKGHACLN